MLLCLLPVLGFLCTARAGAHPLPFRPGERLRYQISWGGIPVGEIRLQVYPLGVTEGVPSWHFGMTTRSCCSADMLFKMREHVGAYTDRQITHSLLYTKRTRGEINRDVQVHFDWKRKVAIFVKNGRKRDETALLPGTFDPLSLVYVLRLQDLRVGKTLQIPVSDGKKCVIGKAKVVGRERILAGGRVYDTFVVEPDLEYIGGVFRKSKDAVVKIWFTADNAKIPVRAESTVPVGSFVAELVYSHGTGGGPAPGSENSAKE